MNEAWKSVTHAKEEVQQKYKRIASEFAGEEVLPEGGRRCETNSSYLWLYSSRYPPQTGKARPHHVSAGISHQSLTPPLFAFTTLRQEALSIHRPRVSSSFGKVQPHSSFTGNRNLFFVQLQQQKIKALERFVYARRNAVGQRNERGRGGTGKRWGENVIKTQKLSWGKSRKKSIDNAVPDWERRRTQWLIRNEPNKETAVGCMALLYTL